MLLLKRKGRGGRYVVPNAVMALLKTNESAPTSPSALFMGAEPIRAHLRAQPRLESESARALAEVARAAQCNYSSGDQRSEPPPRGTIADSRYNRSGQLGKSISRSSSGLLLVVHSTRLLIRSTFGLKGSKPYSSIRYQNYQSRPFIFS